MSSYDPSPPGNSGKNATAVLLAVAILAVIGSVFGYVLGTQANERRDAVATGDGSATPPAPTGKAPGKGNTSTAPSSERCPGFMETAVGRAGGTPPLRLVLYVLTENNKSEVWICRASDSNGKLWYQGHRITKSPYPAEEPREGDNGLLLSTVNGLDANKYLAVNSQDGDKVTNYTVSSTELLIEAKGRNPEREKVVDYRPKG